MERFGYLSSLIFFKEYLNYTSTQLHKELESITKSVYELDPAIRNTLLGYKFQLAMISENVLRYEDHSVFSYFRTIIRAIGIIEMTVEKRLRQGNISFIKNNTGPELIKNLRRIPELFKENEEQAILIYSFIVQTIYYLV